MHLKSLTLTGFKSFPDRTRLDFGPGVSVVVGPNGSGKSNVTDAVLWAMGEQSPLAVRGQSMQDVIFGGGRGVKPRSFAEVEIVLDNSDGAIELPLGEISIVRRLDRSGDGGYRLNGARCRLSDVIEVLSDTGLGKETHSVISQGRVESIVTSKPRERRLLIEEAAGLGKHRKRRRRAQLKLERTQENLDRALDVEREARTRLRPLKRQSEAAELHRRLERQILDARLELAHDSLRTRALVLGESEGRVSAARAARERVEAQLQEVVDRRGAAERALAERAERHDRLAQRVYGARSAHERLVLRGEQALASAHALERRIERAGEELGSLGGEREGAPAPDAADAEEARVAALESELARIESEREHEVEVQTAELQREREREQGVLDGCGGELEQARAAREQADERAAREREALAAAERRAQDARREAERVGAELAAVNQFLRAHARFGADGEAPPKALGEELSVREGYELALAAALGSRLDAALVDDVPGAQALLDRSGPDGGVALLAGSGEDAGAGAAAAPAAPVPGAQRLVELLSGPPRVLALAERLLHDAWVVERLEDVPRDFRGIAATRAGRVLFASAGELRQLGGGGSEVVLARRNERDRLLAAVEQAAEEERRAREQREAALDALRAAEGSVANAEEAVRNAERARVEASEALRRTGWLIEQRRAAPAEGAAAVRQAQLEGELAAERRLTEQRALERRQRAARIAELRARRAADSELVPLARRLGTVLAEMAGAARAGVEALERELEADRQAGESTAGELRACAAKEAEIQIELRAASDTVTAAEVSAQRDRDQVAEAELELASLNERSAELDGAPADPRAGEEPRAAGEPGAGDERDGVAVAAAAESAALSVEEREALDGRLARLERRREQLGPVNPLAREEYAEAVAHVEELERQRADLEGALRELRGVIRETDRQIERTFQETFAAAARNFAELAGDVFPGGSGSLKLVSEERAPSPILGGQPLGGEGSEEAADEEEAEAELQAREEAELPGVEIEITPAGKSTKRLSLLSGGEKSMTALAFLFAVFLARPCPFYILDEVEAALDDLNLDRFLTLLRRHCDRAQFIVITHQRRTMEAADSLYGVTMGADGVSKVISRRLPSEREPVHEVAGAA